MSSRGVKVVEKKCCRSQQCKAVYMREVLERCQRCADGVWRGTSVLLESI